VSLSLLVDRRRLEHPLDLTLLAYLAVSGALLLALGEGWRALGHGGAMLGIAWLRSRDPAFWLRSWYPLPLHLWLYRETSYLGMALWGRTFDGPVLAAEEALFGTSPALWLCERAGWLWLCELLHACYMTFWLLLPGLGLVLQRWHGPRALQIFFWCTYNCFLLCFACFALVPVEGPRHLFPPLPEHLQGPLTRLCHAVTEAGAAAAAALPSSHVAVSVVATACAARLAPRLLWLLGPLVVGIALATVYGRFHYAVDVLAGLAVAGLSWRWLGPAAFERLSGWRP
jgi:membrane-associated phospholipid phosphatase